MLRARLRVISGKHRGKTIPIVGAKFLIGREQDCQLRPNSELISRHHCVISVDPFTVRLRDLASTNGTHVNEQRVNGQLTLKAGDVVRVGKLRFEILISQVSEEELKRNPPTGAATALASLIGKSTSDTTELSDTETGLDIPIPLIIGGGDSGTNNGGGGDSGAFVLNATPPGGHTIVSDSALNAMAANEADTTVLPHNALVPVDPSAAPYQPYGGMGYGQQMPYMPPGAPYQPMPPQYQQPPVQYPYGYGYPQPGPYSQPGMYPQPTYPLAPPPALPQHQPVAPIADEPVEKGGMHTVSMPAITLPDPAKTGVKAPPPPPPKVETADAPADGKPAPVKQNPSQEAANIIRQHMQRRPGT